VVTTAPIDMPGLGELPPGPLRTLTEQMHALYRDAGMPSPGDVANDVGEDGDLTERVSERKVEDLLQGKGVPRWPVLAAVVTVLGQRCTPPVDMADDLVRFRSQWDEVNDAVVREVQRRQFDARLRSVFVLGGFTEAKPSAEERADLADFSDQLGAAIARAGVNLVVCSPFSDSADYFALRGYLSSGFGGTVHMHRPRSQFVERRFEELRDEVGVDAAGQIKNWFYPGPEKDEGEAVGQAWVLCQLMAMEQADAVIAVGGRQGRTATTILHLAEVRRKPVVPFGFLGGAAESALRRRDWASTYPDLDARLLMSKQAAGAAVGIAEQMVTARVRQLDRRLRPPSAVFISRARVDSDYARVLEEYLRESGLAVIFGERELATNRPIESAIEDAVLRSDLFVVLWSRNYAASMYCHDEFELGLRRHRAGEIRLWIINLDGSDIVPPAARQLPMVVARRPGDVVTLARDLLNEETGHQPRRS
jgi:hypothetical protein